MVVSLRANVDPSPKLLTARCLAYRRGLARTVGNARQTWSEREGLVFEMVDSEGRIGRGEAAPLPGYSTDTLEDCARALAPESLAWLLDPEPGDDPRRRHLAMCDDRPGAVDAVLNRLPLSVPAARFALESALLELGAQQQGLTIDEHLAKTLRLTTHKDPRPSDAVVLPTAVLLHAGPGDELQREAARWWVRRQRCFKWKIGRPGQLAAELQALHQLRQQLGSAALLRVDANRMLEPHAWPEAAAELVRLDVEFIEEPLPFDELLRCPKPPGLAIALDETLHGDGGEACLRLALSDQRCDLVILKPTCLGGVLASARLAELAAKHGADAIVSHTWEGEVGQRSLQSLARLLPTSRPHGLGIDDSDPTP